jgi:hypothetical protein
MLLRHALLAGVMSHIVSEIDIQVPSLPCQWHDWLDAAVVKSRRYKNGSRIVNFEFCPKVSILGGILPISEFCVHFSDFVLD